MSGLTLHQLRAANLARQAEWDVGGQIDLAFRVNELAGEVGEACNVIKKLARERLRIRGSRATVEDLAAELADVVICADLVAMSVGAVLADELIAAESRELPLLHAGLWLSVSCGRVSLCAMGDGDPVVLAVRLHAVFSACTGIAGIEGIELGAAVVAKFNATSEKVGLATRLEVRP